MMLIEWISALAEDHESKYLTSDAPEFSELGGFVDAGDFASISSMNESLMEKGIYDIRFLIYALYHELSEDRLTSLPLLVQTMMAILGKWSLIGPENKKDKYAKSSIVWIFRQFMVDLQTLELSSETTLPLWHAEIDEEALGLIRDGFKQLRQWFSSNFESSLADAVQSPLTELTDWLKDYELAMPKPEAIPDEQSTPESQNGANADQQNSLMDGRSVFNASNTFGSRHLDELNSKIQTFQLLASRGEMLKAAIVVSDIAQILETFDARKYLPSLFSPYFETLAKNVYALTEMQEHSGSAHWVVLNDLYATDLEKFTELRVDF